MRPNPEWLLLLEFRPHRVRPSKNRIFKRVPHDPFLLTPVDENGGLGCSVGANRGAAVPPSDDQFEPGYRRAG